MCVPCQSPQGLTEVALDVHLLPMVDGVPVSCEWGFNKGWSSMYKPCHILWSCAEWTCMLILVCLSCMFILAGFSCMFILACVSIHDYHASRSAFSLFCQCLVQCLSVYCPVLASVLFSRVIACILRHMARVHYMFYLCVPTRTYSPSLFLEMFLGVLTQLSQIKLSQRLTCCDIYPFTVSKSF